MLRTLVEIPNGRYIPKPKQQHTIPKKEHEVQENGVSNPIFEKSCLVLKIQKIRSESQIRKLLLRWERHWPKIRLLDLGEVGSFDSISETIQTSGVFFPKKNSCHCLWNLFGQSVHSGIHVFHMGDVTQQKASVILKHQRHCTTSRSLGIPHFFVEVGFEVLATLEMNIWTRWSCCCHQHSQKDPKIWVTIVMYEKNCPQPSFCKVPNTWCCPIFTVDRSKLLELIKPFRVEN